MHACPIPSPIAPLSHAFPSLHLSSFAISTHFLCPLRLFRPHLFCSVRQFHFPPHISASPPQTPAGKIERMGNTCQKSITPPKPDLHRHMFLLVPSCKTPAAFLCRVPERRKLMCKKKRKETLRDIYLINLNEDERKMKIGKWCGRDDGSRLW